MPRFITARTVVAVPSYIYQRRRLVAVLVATVPSRTLTTASALSGLGPALDCDTGTTGLVRPGDTRGRRVAQAQG